jgi:glycyl-tRNA synthetase beta chain
LLEIGVEELPSSFVDAALAALPQIAAAKLAAARLPHGAMTPLGTPRRLAIVVHDVATRQLDLDEEIVGPPEAAAFKDGKPTKVAEAFAAKVGCDVSALAVIEREAGPKQDGASAASPARGQQKRAGRYVVGRRVERGKEATELLGKVLAEVCAAIPFKKSMRWADLEATFGRPVQWVVALLGDKVVDVSFAGVRSGRVSRGHRFFAPDPFDVKSAGTYVAQLRERHVVVDREERARTMMERVAAAARAAGGTFDPEPSLVDENASLVEEPHVVTGSFDRAYLELPAAVIRAAARGHQKYFCVHIAARGAASGALGDEELLPHYIAVVNTANRPENVAKGNDRVMRARLADARFFYEEDKKAGLDARVDKLAGIVFHNRLGTVREKVTRIERLADRIAEMLDLDAPTCEQVRRAAHLCKFDLVSLMVGEFPELQGHMGRVYARHAGESDRVADAVRDHYKPVGASDAVAQDDVAACVALADRFDSLAGCFAVGLAPTGTADPFALRRACIGALRTILDLGTATQGRPHEGRQGGAYAHLAFGEVVGVAYDGFEGSKLDLSRTETIAKLVEFATERLRGLVTSTTSSAVADAILAGEAEAVTRHPVHAMARARALQAIVDAKEPWLDKAKTVAKRLAGISREARPVLHDASEFASSKKSDDVAIQRLVEELQEITIALTSEAAVRSALVTMEKVASELDRIFAETLINDPVDALTPKRLELLSYGAHCMLRIADFSKLG